MTQLEYESATDRLSQYLIEVEDAGGYGGLQVHPSERRADLYWKGALPAELVELLEEVKTACAVRVVPAAHDVLELQRARSRITSSPGCASSGIVTLALSPDGSGLELGYEGDEPPRHFVDGLGLDVPISWERGGVLPA